MLLCRKRLFIIRLSKKYWLTLNVIETETCVSVVGVRERKNIGKIDDVCGSVNFEDAFTEGGETHFESSRWRPRGESGEGVNPSVAEHFHIW